MDEVNTPEPTIDEDPVKMWETFRDNLSIKDRKYHLKTYKNCFVGSDAITLLQDLFNIKDRIDAISIGNAFFDLGLFHHVTKDHKLKDEFLFYELNEEFKEKCPEALEKVMLDKKKSISLIKVEETQQEQLSVTEVNPDIFPKMVTSSGESIYDLNKKGWKVLLLFPSSIGCPYCQGTMEDVYNLYEQLLKLNALPVICHEESDDLYHKFINTNDRTKKYAKFLHIQRNEFKNDFLLEKENQFIKLFTAAKRGVAELIRLKGVGVKKVRDVVIPEANETLAACFVIKDSKIVSEYRKEHKYQRFDVARIVIDTDGFGIEIHTSVFECEIPKKSENKIEKLKQKTSLLNKSFLKQRKSIDEISEMEIGLKEVLENPKYLSFFKLFSTTEYNVENIIFYEEIIFLKKSKKNEIENRCRMIFETFLTRESIYEINTNSVLINQVYDKLEKGEFEIDIFDDILKDLKNSVFRDMFTRFVTSDYFHQMKTKKRKKNNYLLYK